MSKTLVNKYTKSDILLDFLPPLIFFLLRIFCHNFRSVLFAKKKMSKNRFPLLPSLHVFVRACMRLSFSLYAPPFPPTYALSSCYSSAYYSQSEFHAEAIQPTECELRRFLQRKTEHVSGSVDQSCWGRETHWIEERGFPPVTPTVHNDANAHTSSR